MRYYAHVSDASRTDFLFRLHQVLHICPRSSQGRCICEDIQLITIISYLLYRFHDHCRCETTAVITRVILSLSFIHSGYLYSASSSALIHRGAPDYIIDTVSELTRRTATGICKGRTCSRSLLSLPLDITQSQLFSLYHDHCQCQTVSEIAVVRISLPSSSCYHHH